ncbi:helix-turn-helix transcriptional regulator [Neofamilia massiliensis]|uniref:helix-turn-helix transcriptional regulator n=1 Tax=Neofamilia massiliensis TaxID=1673724 RepID=UPI000A812CE8|nr:helix-turn-helix transcriptional regulator [Neofamilia massiliensis]
MMRNRIAEHRKPLGLSQHRLGKKIGISRISINQIETGKTVPSLKTANDIANALGVCMYQIFDLDGEETYKCHSSNCC